VARWCGGPGCPAAAAAAQAEEGPGAGRGGGGGAGARATGVVLGRRMVQGLHSGAKVWTAL
jgi:hypothetical protein